MRHIHLILILQLLMLLALANGTPLIAKKIFGTGFAHPLDKGVTLADGQPLFGHSKTIRGSSRENFSWLRAHRMRPWGS
jgi:CDP-archaeol synthase